MRPRRVHVSQRNPQLFSLTYNMPNWRRRHRLYKINYSWRGERSLSAACGLGRLNRSSRHRGVAVLTSQGGCAAP